MKKAVLVTVLIGLCSTNNVAEALTTEDCVNVVAAVNKPATEITPRSIDDFLYALMAPECRGNVEYTEWSNETIFHLMEDVPALFFARIKALGPPIKSAILKELKQPIHDMLNYPAIYHSITTKITDEGLRTYAMKLFAPFFKQHIKYVKKWEGINKRKWEYERR